MRQVDGIVQPSSARLQIVSVVHCARRQGRPELGSCAAAITPRDAAYPGILIMHLNFVHSADQSPAISRQAVHRIHATRNLACCTIQASVCSSSRTADRSAADFVQAAVHARCAGFLRIYEAQQHRPALLIDCNPVHNSA